MTCHTNQWQGSFLCWMVFIIISQIPDLMLHQMLDDLSGINGIGELDIIQGVWPWQQHTALPNLVTKLPMMSLS